MNLVRTIGLGKWPSRPRWFWPSHWPERAWPPPLHFWSLTGNSGTNPRTNVLGTTDNQRLVIKPNGKVGIVTSSPVTKLDLVSGSMRVVDGDAASVTDYFTNDPSRSYLTVIARSAGGQTERRINNDGPADSKLTFYDATAGNDLMVLDRDGNLGIGTTSPARKLHIPDVIRLDPIRLRRHPLVCWGYVLRRLLGPLCLRRWLLVEDSWNGQL